MLCRLKLIYLAVSLISSLAMVEALSQGQEATLFRRKQMNLRRLSWSWEGWEGLEGLDGLEGLEGLSLTSLHISWTQIEYLSHLQKMDFLQALYFANTFIGDELLKYK